MTRLPDEIAAIRRDLGRRLAAFREAAGATQAALGKATGYSRPSIAHVETGRQWPDEQFWHAADEFCQVKGELVALHARACEQEAARRQIDLDRANAQRRQRASLAVTQAAPTAVRQWRSDGPDQGGPCGPDIAAAAQASIEFAQWATADQVEQLSIESLSYELTRIATAYVHAPMQPLFSDLQVLRDRARMLLGTRPQPRQARELFYLGGVTVVLLSHASQNLGDSMAAMQQAMAAQRLAEQADHADLRGWVAGTQALIAEWTGNPQYAADLARQGAPHVQAGQGKTRMLALQARASARTGNANATRAALAELQVEMESADDAVSALPFGGILSFPRTKALYYAGTALTHLGDYDAAERYAAAAIAAWENGPPNERSYGDEALARVDVAVSRIACSDVDGASEILAPVLALDPNRRIRQVADGLDRVRAGLNSAKYQRSMSARALQEQVAAFRSIASLPELRRRQ